eukprot:scaffold8933_cov78-Skeletonema_dohrnii-CCMP3373.AAC.1
MNTITTMTIQRISIILLLLATSFLGSTCAAVTSSSTTAASFAEDSSSFGVDGTHEHRSLQEACPSCSRRKCCNKTPDCEWVGNRKNGDCLLIAAPPATPPPTPQPTDVVTPSPTPEPTNVVTPSPTPEPTEVVTPSPTSNPTPLPSSAPTSQPTEVVTQPPTPQPTVAVTQPPTPQPTEVVTQPPTPQPTNVVTPAPTPNPTPVTTPNPTNAPPPPSPPTSTLTIVFSEPGAPPNPLPECRGDCDDDSQCEGDLVCFQRSGVEAVPYCTGTATSGFDFCARRPTQNTVWLKGDNGSPSANFPLGLCEGDCDSDADCQLGLVCQQRTGTEAIPECIGNPEPGEDYCRYPELTFVGNPPPATLGVCEGDCDTDSDCGPNLECFQRPATEAVTGCLGTGGSGTDYCALRLSTNTLFLKGNNGSPSANFPLGLCEGDCDSDAECGPGLVCMQRSGNEPVPNCIGTPTFEEDYCYDPNGGAPSPAPGPPPTYAPNTFGA